MTEHGFFHPSRGYWQTTGTPSQHIVGGYPEGTVEVPLKPSGDHEWDGSRWVEIAPEPPTLAEQKAARAAAYANESDPLFFKWQRGEITKQEWQDKIAEIRARYPYPVGI